MSNDQPPLWIITGQREGGKTSFCRALLEEAGKRKIDAAGVISPAIFSNGIKTGFELVNIRTGAKRLLAVLRHGDRPGIATDHWQFDTQSFAWGSEILENSVPCELLIVDELGPLEFEQKGGWQSGISSLSSGKYKCAVVVIRPELLVKAQSLWPHGRIIQVDHILSQDETAARIEEIFSSFERD